MKLLIGVLFSTLLLTSCGSTKYQYQSQQNSAQWMGQSTVALQKKWGEADQVMHTRTGSTYYVYLSNSGTNFFNSTSTNFSTSESGYNSSFPLTPESSNMSLKCSTIFQANASGIITNISHQGSNCGGEWVPKNTKNS